MRQYQWAFEPRAMLEYSEAVIWYKNRSATVAENFITEVNNRLDDICASPTSYRKVKKNYREAILNRYPFSIIYVVYSEHFTVLVLSIFHHRRNPKAKFKR